MKNVICTILIGALALCAAAAQEVQDAPEATAAPAVKRVLYVYEEENDSTAPYRTLFGEELKAAGFEANEAAAADLSSIKLADYDILVIHGMVIAFGNQSPVRDWLKTEPDLAGKPVSLFVTASRWRLEKVYKNALTLLEARKPLILDAVSSATKKLDDEGKRALVREHVQKLK